MHLLPHKSWNPYSQKNIDKVRKDEREHEKKTLEEKKRKLGYEQEARYERLKRQKISHNDNTAESADAIATLFGATSTEKTDAPVEEQKHFNLFPELEAKEKGEVFEPTERTSKQTKQTNPEHEAEERAKQERLNRQLTTYLGQSSSEYTKNKPWYEGGTSEISAAKQQRMERRKSEADPLSAMNKYMTVKGSDAVTRPSQQQLAVVRAQLDSSRRERAKEEQIRAPREDRGEGEHTDTTDKDRSDRDKKDKRDKDTRDKKHKDKKDKREKKDKRDKDKKDKRGKDKETKDDTLERLRRERMARENEERAQLQRLVSGPGAQTRGPARDQRPFQSRAHNTGTRVERGGERMREDY